MHTNLRWRREDSLRHLVAYLKNSHLFAVRVYQPDFLLLPASEKEIGTQ